MVGAVDESVVAGDLIDQDRKIHFVTKGIHSYKSFNTLSCR